MSVVSFVDALREHYRPERIAEMFPTPSRMDALYHLPASSVFWIATGRGEPVAMTAHQRRVARRARKRVSPLLFLLRGPK